MPAHQLTAVFPGADMMHIYSFRLADNGAENPADNWGCVEIRISDNICTLEPPSVSMFVK